ncbi:hypothetical protein OXX79_008561 [Metschnikowia pulcherrima]
MAGLTDDQKRRIEENRKRALERLQQRKAGTLGADISKPNATSIPTTNTNTNPPSSIVPTVAAPQNAEHRSIPELPRVELTREQKERITKNRERALQIQKEKSKSFRDATDRTGPVAVVTEQDRKRFKPEYNPPSIQKKDYIEYDFSTMKDSRGGFLDESEKNGLRRRGRASESTRMEGETKTRPSRQGTSPAARYCECTPMFRMRVVGNRR